MSLMISISGIRGVVGDTLTPEVAVRYAAAFGEYCRRKNPENPSVVVGRDGRVTGPPIADLICSTLRSTGSDVRYLGICPTPTVQLAVEHENATGGISVTASHNPLQWNGMKFVAASGMFLDAEENRELWAIADLTPHYVPWDRLGTLTHDETWLQKHIDAVLSLTTIDPALIRKRRFRVVLDCVNAAGGLIVPRLLRSLGCDVIEMNCECSGIFMHTPEPIPENLTDLAARVKAEGADLGIAVDPDVDRLVLITEEGEPYSEEYTVASAVKFVLQKITAQKAIAGGNVDRVSANSGLAEKVVVNLSTTRAVEDIAREFGAEVIRTPVGEINVARKMKAVGAVIGGEGSGGVILPALHLGRDAIVGVGLILQLLAEHGGTISSLKHSLPQYSIAKGRIELGTREPDSILKAIVQRHGTEGRVNLEDGVKIDFPEYWVHLRKSNTEPIVRVIAEGRSMQKAREIVENFRREITELI